MSPAPISFAGFVTRFESTFVGLTDSLERRATTWNACGVTVMEGRATPSSCVCVIDPSGRLAKVPGADAVRADLAADMKTCLWSD